MERRELWWVVAMFTILLVVLFSWAYTTHSWFSSGDALAPCVTLSGDISVVTPGGFATGISHSEASRGAAKHPIMHRTDPPPQ